ncbi:flagellar hook capping FlgD N-terminal domain-containing protein [Roseobacter litoralis]|uniref:flagellar hook assembly protein FlgD n=1 Tax=Roseobacter litoralis TaxID=42443 RepID=UPI002490D736|nr:flagellar hook capping FlgD N-terminal domain-containing protein [Roseobacter litoralis]
MDILNAQAIQPTTQLGTAQASNSAALSSDFETFLKMLTAQARFQDPLEPIDSSEYAAQLAQFSMVEQQVLSNDLLTELGAQLGSNSIGQMAAWIGMEARTTAPVAFDGSPITVLPKSEAGADEAYLVAYGPDGSEVQRQAITPGTDPIEWFGLDDNGTALPIGNYSFVVESRAVGQAIGTSPAETYSRITEARREGTDTVFILNGGSPVSAADVSALREASLQSDP